MPNVGAPLAAPPVAAPPIAAPPIAAPPIAAPDVHGPTVQGRSKQRPYEIVPATRHGLSSSSAHRAGFSTMYARMRSNSSSSHTTRSK
jgi:hypothetical protein